MLVSKTVASSNIATQILANMPDRFSRFDICYGSQGSMLNSIGKSEVEAEVSLEFQGKNNVSELISNVELGLRVLPSFTLDKKSVFLRLVSPHFCFYINGKQREILNRILDEKFCTLSEDKGEIVSFSQVKIGSKNIETFFLLDNKFNLTNKVNFYNIFSFVYTFNLFSGFDKMSKTNWSYRDLTSGRFLFCVEARHKSVYLGLEKGYIGANNVTDTNLFILLHLMRADNSKDALISLALKTDFYLKSPLAVLNIEKSGLRFSILFDNSGIKVLSFFIKKQSMRDHLTKKKCLFIENRQKAIQIKSTNYA